MAETIIKIQDVDFLPEQYREEGVKRRAHVWWLVLAVVFGGFFVGTTWLQHHFYRTVTAELSRVDVQYASAVAREKHLVELEARLKPKESMAELITYLRHPWPRARIVQAVVSPLPDAVVLTELHILHESANKSPLREEVSSAGGVAPAPDKSNPAARDLKRLRGELDNVEWIVVIGGTTTDTAALHEYLGVLGRNSLFAKAELGAIESAPRGDNGGAHFSARLILRPGYGQPNGPAPSTASLAGSTAESIDRQAQTP